jgi:hypothetical protein
VQAIAGALGDRDVVAHLGRLEQAIERLGAEAGQLGQLGVAVNAVRQQLATSAATLSTAVDEAADKETPS